MRETNFPNSLSLKDLSLLYKTMTDLILSILFATSIFVTFKQLDRYKADIFNVIVVNYLVATALGFWLSPPAVSFNEVISSPWLAMSILIGCLFIINFFLIGRSSARAGIAVTTIASKMSMVLPILFSMLYYQENISPVKIAGITMASVAVILTITKNNPLKVDLLRILLPVILFFGTGITDAAIKYTQHNYLGNGDTLQFSFYLFMVSTIIALIIAVFRKSSFRNFFQPPVLLGGTILGFVNFYSLYYFIQALNHSGLDSSIVFGIANMSIVALSVVAGLFLFRERMSKLNWAGILLSLISLFILLNYN